MFQPVWSPDSSKIAWADKDLKLWYVDIKEKKPVEVDRGKYGEIQNYNWSPDSKWLAYDKNLESGYSVVYLYGLADRKITAVTSIFNNSYGGRVRSRQAILIFSLRPRLQRGAGERRLRVCEPENDAGVCGHLDRGRAFALSRLERRGEGEDEEPAAGGPEPEAGGKAKKKNVKHAEQERRKSSPKRKLRKRRPRSLREFSKSISTAFRTGSWRWPFLRR
jgi:hypothetical protein